MDGDLSVNCSQWLSELTPETADRNHPCVHYFNKLYPQDDTPPTSNGPPNWVHLIVQVFYTIVFVFGLAGNILIIFVISRLKKRLTATHIYLFNFAIAEIIFLIGIPFLVVTVKLGHWPFGIHLCKAYFATTMVNSFTFAPILLVLSCDRFLTVCDANKTEKIRTPTATKIIAIFIWTVSALLIMPVVGYAKTLATEHKVHCNVFWPDTDFMNGSTFFLLYSLIFGYALYVPVLFTLTLYLISKCCKSSPPSHITEHSPDDAEGSNEKKRSQELTKLVICFVTAFLICRTPLWTIQIKFHFMTPGTNDFEIMIVLFLFAGCLCYANTLVNPLLLLMFSSEFRERSKEVLFCKKKKNGIHSRWEINRPQPSQWSNDESGHTTSVAETQKI